MKTPLISLALALLLLSTNANAQQQLSRDEILAMSMDDLSELSLEELMQAVETLGVGSVDELFALIMNKNVSSASKEEESSFTSPLATTVITKDELRTYGATTLEDAFRLIPGMIVTQKTNGVYDIHMRGLNNIPDNNMLMYTDNNNTLLMVDGRTVQNFVTGAIMLHTLPVSIEDIERIEVVRGACSALYGMNAVTGVINIITEKPTADSKEVSGGIQMGNRSTVTADIALRHAFNDKWSAGFTVNTQYRERPTSKLYIPGNDNLVYLNNSEAQSSGLITEEEYENSSNYEVLSEGGYYSISDIINNIRNVSYVGNYTYWDCTTGTYYPNYNAETEPSSQYYLGNVLEDGASLSAMFPNPKRARRNIGLNGYVRFAPQPDIVFNLSGGYQNSFVNTTPVRNDLFTMNGQESKTAYANLDAQIKNLHFQASYTGGPQNFAYGVDGYKMTTNNLNLQAEYDFKIGDFSIRPAVSWLYLKYYDKESSYTDASGTVTQQYGILGGEAELSTISPSARIDWQNNGWRAVFGVRGDHTSKPDKWNVSFQGELSKSINSNNFIRLVYGRAFRAPNMINTSANFVQSYEGRSFSPSQFRFKGSDDADLMKIDNFELGYRFQPTPALLLDAEIFYSHSQDYGALMSDEGAVYLRQDQFTDLMSSLTTQLMSGATAYTAAYNVYSNLSTYSSLVYKNLPYTVNQVGLSLNIDWIVSPKLILKLNANVQRTHIDNYYVYSMQDAVYKQFNGESNAAASAQAAIVSLISGTVNPTYYSDGSSYYMADAFGKANVIDFKEEIGYESWSTADQTALQELLFSTWKEAAANGTSREDLSLSYTTEDGTVHNFVAERPLTLYYALRYSVLLDEERSEYTIGNSEYEEDPRHNGHVHKSTPSVYGMIGAIFKPISPLTISAYCNYIGKRTYNTSYSKYQYQYSQDGEYSGMKVDGEKLKAKFTVNLKVGYQPVTGTEIFISANNLFNDNKREATLSDKIGGLYTVGVNFSF